MNNKAKSDHFFTVGSSRGRDSKSGMFIERTSDKGKFSTSVINQDKLNSALNRADNKLREVSGRFIVKVPHSNAKR